MHQIPSKVLMHFCFMCNAVVILQRNFHNIRIYVFKHMISSRRADNIRRYGSVCTENRNATLGHNMF